MAAKRSILVITLWVTCQLGAFAQLSFPAGKLQAKLRELIKISALFWTQTRQADEKYRESFKTLLTAIAAQQHKNCRL
jgi:hypothetical protein